MPRFVELNGISFEVVKPRSENVFNRHSLSRIKTLDHWYVRPSYQKQLIYKLWCDWCFETEGVDLCSVTSANCQTFTLSANYDTPELRGLLIITKAHNRLYVRD